MAKRQRIEAPWEREWLLSGTSLGDCETIERMSDDTPQEVMLLLRRRETLQLDVKEANDEEARARSARNRLEVDLANVEIEIRKLLTTLGIVAPVPERSTPPRPSAILDSKYDVPG